MKQPPRIGAREFADRRSELMALMEPDSIAIVPGSLPRYRNQGVAMRFRQDSDFHYLTGFDEPEAVFALIPGREHGASILFCRERGADVERWHGAVTGPEGAMACFGMDDAFPVDDIDDILPGLIEGRSKLYYAMGAHPRFDDRVISWVGSISSDRRSGTRPPGEFIELGQYLHELRLHKTKAEIIMLQHAASVTSHAHRSVMEKLAPGMMEYEIEAELHYQFAVRGVRESAYPSIVGGGANACIFHYVENDQRLRDGDLVLIDAGCEYGYYASDVTRTLPVNGRFSVVQAALYEIVLQAELDAIAEIRVGNHWNRPHEAAVRTITRGLRDLGLLDGSVDELVASGAYQKFYVHRTGHWLGLDVHDVGEYRVGGQWREFEKGMVCSVEPGLYIPPDASDVPAEMRGIGIRIEDNVAVTATGNVVLTESIPKRIVDIEAAMGAGNGS
jgi:Xaa-Pro aminopeptidase